MEILRDFEESKKRPQLFDKAEQKKIVLPTKTKLDNIHYKNKSE